MIEARLDRGGFHVFTKWWCVAAIWSWRYTDPDRLVHVEWLYDDSIVVCVGPAIVKLSR